MSEEEQRDLAIGLRETFGKVASDVSSKAAAFHDVTADAAQQGAHEMENTDSEFGNKLNELGNGPVQPATPKPSEPQLPRPGGGAPATPGPVSDDFQGGNQGGVGADGVSQTPGCHDPIDPVSGQMMTSATDAALDGVLPLLLRRTYCSGYGHGALFGPGWSSTLDQRVIVDEDGIHFLGDDAQVLNYGIPLQPGQQMLPAAGARCPLTWDRKLDAIAILDPATGVTRHFAPPPRDAEPDARGRDIRHLTRITDRNGNWLTITRDADGIPIRVDHVGGYRISVDSSYQTGDCRIDALSLDDEVHPGGGMLAGFLYDRAGRLAEVVRTGRRKLRYEYDDADRITAWIDQAGYRYSYAYDDDGRVTRVGGEDGTLAAHFAYDREARRTRVTDSYGATTEYWYDEHNHLTKVIDPLGNSTALHHDRFGRLIEHTDPLGAGTRFTRDAFGNVLEVERADGSTARAEYSALHQPTRIVAPDGATARFEYDARGNLTRSIDAAGAESRYVYNDHGGLINTVDPLGNTTQIAVNQAGLPVEVTDALGGRCVVTRDSRGNATGIQDPLGNLTTAEFDIEGRVTARTTPDGARESWEYDERGNIARHISPAGAATTFEYGPFRRLLARTEPDGSRYEFTHDRELRLESVTNPASGRWSYVYDAAGSLVAESDFNGRRLSYSHDAAGRLLERVNGAGQAVAFVRDVLGSVLEQHVDGVATATFTYDANGALLRAANQDAEIVVTRDAAGRVIAESTNGRTLARAYDGLGNRTSRTTPSGRASTWQYDALGRPQRLDAAGAEISFAFDEAGREAYRWIGSTTAITSEWDAVGRLTARRVLAVEETAGARTSQLMHESSWAYRADGAPESLSDSVAGRRNLAFDPNGRVTAVTAESWTETYAYDALGNITSATDSRDEAAPTAGAREVDGTLLRRAGRTSYEYDTQHRLVRTVRRNLSGGRKVWAYQYDAYDRMTGVTTPDGQAWTYRYDPLGRRIAKQRLGPDGTVLEHTRFTWDGAALAEQEHTRTGAEQVEITTWDYEPGTWTPVAQDRRIRYGQTPQEVVDRQFHAIVTDLIGTPTELVTPDGTIGWRRSAGLWGNRLVGAPETDTPDCPLGFPGQYHDAETGFDYNFRRYYDPNTGRYATPDPIGLAPAPNHHGYVSNPLTWLDPLGLAALGGNPIKWGEKDGEYGPFHRKASPTQTPEDTQKMIDSGELWGGAGRLSDTPWVQAHAGPLPEGELGIEFWSPVKPNPNDMGHRANWSGGRPGVMERDGGKMAAIPIRVTKVNHSPAALPGECGE